MNIKVNYFIFFTFISLVFTRCSKPIADFYLTPASLVVPTKIELTNTSKKADKYEWRLGDSIISEEVSSKYLFTQSGRHSLTLKASKGKKSSMLSREIILKAPEDCLVLLTTSEGTVVIKLYNNTLIHQNNFIELVEKGFYKEILFHRVINGFMIQAGDPMSKNATSGQRLGSGDIGYTLPKEINKENFHVKGALAAARIGDQANPEKRSSGCQFYIVHGEPITEQQLMQNELRFDIKYPEHIKQKYLTQGGAPQLDMNYTVFGEVVEGIEVIDKTAQMKTDSNNRPTSDVKIIDCIIIK
ncbi:MAG TPA: peptidylprolyl isomerase [Saprospiraceae bacterium]|nr:peptidylprolyl isomerase [Saprospiraceae bacterium]